ncbi:MAG: hypothetical protein ACFCGT_21145 [Sandaracinaceae bacterium]
MAPLRRTVPTGLVVVAAVAALSGCFDSHGRGAGPDGEPPLRDLSIPSADAGRPDLGADEGVDHGPPPVDAGSPRLDVPLPCWSRPLDFACTGPGSGAVAVGENVEILVAFGGLGACYCGEGLGCAAAVDESTRTLALTSTMCAEAVCTLCHPFVTRPCRLPPLTEGRYAVTVNGEYAFDLEASDAPATSGPVERCHTRARPDRFGCTPTAATRPAPVREVCHPTRIEGRAPTNVRATADCLLCPESLGPCTVTRTAMAIDVEVLAMDTTCPGGCSAACASREMACVLPPLPPGTYTLRVSGLPGVSTLEVDPEQPEADESVCLTR